VGRGVGRRVEECGWDQGRGPHPSSALQTRRRRSAVDPPNEPAPPPPPSRTAATSSQRSSAAGGPPPPAAAPPTALQSRTRGHADAAAPAVEGQPSLSLSAARSAETSNDGSSGAALPAAPLAGSGEAIASGSRAEETAAVAVALGLDSPPRSVAAPEPGAGGVHSMDKSAATATSPPPASSLVPQRPPHGAAVQRYPVSPSKSTCSASPYRAPRACSCLGDRRQTPVPRSSGSGGRSGAETTGDAGGAPRRGVPVPRLFRRLREPGVSAIGGFDTLREATRRTKQRA